MSPLLAWPLSRFVSQTIDTLFEIPSDPAVDLVFRARQPSAIFFEAHAIGRVQYYTASFLHKRPGIEVLYAPTPRCFLVGFLVILIAVSYLGIMQKPCQHICTLIFSSYYQFIVITISISKYSRYGILPVLLRRKLPN